jgi:Zn-dependent protease
MEPFFIIAILIISVIVHEISHGYMALYLGDPTAKYEGRLTLNPLKHLDPIGSVLVPILGYISGGIIIGWAKPVPFNPYNLRNQRWGEALVALAGPISNIVLAVIFAIAIRFATSSGLTSPGFFFLASYLVFINIVLAIFNLMPIPPLDGSKILFALFPSSFQRIRHSIESFGIILILIFIFFLWQFIAPLASIIFSLLVGQPLI